MLSVKIICVGRLKEKFYEQACAEYLKRLGGYCRAEITELAERKLSQAPSPAEIAQALEGEARDIMARLPKAACLISLCVEGEALSSEELSDRLQRLTASGRSSLVFVIGGSYGLAPSVKSASALRLSMSRMTFPHHLARVMLLEQLYRSFKIDEGSKYHK